MPLEAGADIITQEDFQFAGDATYSIQFILGTGTCPQTLSDGTVTAAIKTIGGYTEGSANTILGGDWKMLTYDAELFETTLTKSNKPSFFTPGQRIGTVQVGPCTDLQPYFSNATVGCPCNGTWNVSGFANGVSSATRRINKTECYDQGNSTCPENFFFNTARRYGSFRVYNNSNNTMRILEITSPSTNMTEGYNNSVVHASFEANFTCPVTASDTDAPTPAPSGFGPLIPSAMLLCLALL
jgi:hypothetical protein